MAFPMLAVLLVAGASLPHSTPRISPNANRAAAGKQVGNEVHITLTARTGEWYPDGNRRPAALTVAAFAEGDGAPSIPGPLVRVRAGTHLSITVRNALDGRFATRQLVVHGLVTRPAAQDSVVRIAPGAEETIAFDAGAPGTYHYWAAFTDTTLNGRRQLDAGLSGAFIVDSATGPIPPDRIFVLTRMVLPAEGEGAEHQPRRFATTINGLSWPMTERLDAAVGDTVHWRWINATSNSHPMHLHGFYYHVDALGNERRDTTFAGELRKLVVTERLAAGATMAMTWVPERAGNWLMHCHLQVHTGPDDGWGFPDIPGTPPFGPGTQKTPAAPMSGHDMTRDMAGLILGISVHDSARSGSVTLAGEPAVRRTVTLSVLPRETGEGIERMVTQVDDPEALNGSKSAKSAGVGAPIVLRRGEPSRITVRNSSGEMTAVHWHAMELDSYYDGVAGYSGSSGRTSPGIAPGQAFDALMTPPRAGTFIYHAHMLTSTQLADGLYGPLIVVADGETYDPASEIAWTVGGPTVDSTHTLFLNGSHAPPPLTLTAGHRYRVRLINIGETNDALVALMNTDRADATPVEWRALAKDAIALPAARAVVAPARLRMSVGETYDFELVPQKPGTMALEVRVGPTLMAAQQVIVR